MSNNNERNCALIQLSKDVWLFDTGSTESDVCELHIPSKRYGREHLKKDLQHIVSQDTVNIDQLSELLQQHLVPPDVRYIISTVLGEVFLEEVKQRICNEKK